mgnify:FL=1
MKKLRELLRANRWLAAVLLLEAAVLASLVASLFGAPYKLQLSPADFANEYPQIAAVNDDGTALQIWNNSEDFVPPKDKAMTFSTTGSAVRSGAYEVTVQYFSCQTPDEPTFNALHSAGSLSFASAGNPSAIHADAVILDDCHRTVTTRLWVGYGAKMRDLTATLTYGEGQLYLYGITLTEQPIYRAARLVGFVLLAALLDLALLLLFARGDENAPARRRRYAVPLVLAGIALLASLPLFSNYLYFGHDLDYHLQRITAMAAELSYGQFPVRLTTDSLNGYGYANPLCYCELFLTLPALLYNAWLPLRTCYQVYIFAVTLATAAIAYYSFGTITASRKLGLLGAGLYTLSCYRMVCIYVRAAVGEYTAIAFLPLILAGLYNIYTTEKPRFAQWAPMAFGMAALVQCHLLSCELIALLLVVFCLLRLRETLRPARLLAWLKAALLALALSAWYFFPFLLSTREINLMVNGPLIGKIQGQGTYLVQLFSPFGCGYGGTADGTSNDMTLTLGLPLAAGFVLVIYCLLRRERWQQQETLRRMQTAFGFAMLTLVLSLRVFPWDGVQNWLGRAAGKMAGMFQYPWRFLSLATVLLCLAVLLAVQLLQEKNVRLAKGAAAALAACALLTVGVVQTQITTGMSEQAYNVFLNRQPNATTGVGEYLIDGTSGYETIWAQPKPGSEELQLLSYEKRGGKAYLTVENDGDAADISVPIFNYGHYYAVDEATGDAYALGTGENARITLNIPAGYTGTIVIAYHAPVYWRAFELVSLLALIGSVGWGASQRKKKQ